MLIPHSSATKLFLRRDSVLCSGPSSAVRRKLLPVVSSNCEARRNIVTLQNSSSTCKRAIASPVQKNSCDDYARCTFQWFNSSISRTAVAGSYSKISSTFAPFQSGAAATTTTRLLSSSSEPPLPEDADHLHSRRHAGIIMNPKSVSKDILPDGMVKKPNSSRKSFPEFVYGYFWMIKDLRRTEDGKVILSNEKLISEGQAKPFPSLSGFETVASMSGSSSSDDDSGGTVTVPDFFYRKNRTSDPKAQCTLVAVSFRGYGFELTKSWTEPFEAAVMKNKHDNRMEVVQLILNEGYLFRYLLKPFIRSQTVKNTPAERGANTLLHFSSDFSNFRDSLRMHNLMTGYVFLLDGVGRVRFAGSGKASEEEVERLVSFAEELTQKERRLVGSTNIRK